MEGILTIIQTVGFPIACVIGLGYFCFKYINRIMDENKSREDRYNEMLVSYGANMAVIAKSMEKIENRLDSIENKIN